MIDQCDNTVRTHGVHCQQVLLTSPPDKSPALTSNYQLLQLFMVMTENRLKMDFYLLMKDDRSLLMAVWQVHEIVRTQHVKIKIMKTVGGFLPFLLQLFSKVVGLPPKYGGTTSSGGNDGSVSDSQWP